MHELPSTQHSLIAPFFPPGSPGYAFVGALLEGNHQGRVYVDNTAAPSTCLAALACDYTFVAGRADDDVTNRAIRSLVAGALSPDDGYVLLFPTSDAWAITLADLFADAPELIRAGRLSYDLDQEAYLGRYAGWQARLPADCTIRRYDQDLSRGQGLAAFWGSLEAFLDRGFGFAVLRGDEVLSRCHTVFVGRGLAEISIETPDIHRRQGLATLATCAFIEHCLQIGLTPAWSCWDNNEPSQRLAEHLGFSHRRESLAYVIRPA